MDDIASFDLDLGADEEVPPAVTPGARLTRSPVGEFSPLFQTPSSQASDVTGGDGSVGVRGLFVIGKLDVVCGGAISGSAGKQFCTKFEVAQEFWRGVSAKHTLYQGKKGPGTVGA